MKMVAKLLLLRRRHAHAGAVGTFGAASRDPAGACSGTAVCFRRTCAGASARQTRRSAAQAAHRQHFHRHIQQCQAGRARHADGVLCFRQKWRLHRHPSGRSGLGTISARMRSTILPAGAERLPNDEVTIVPAAMRTFTMTVDGYMHKVRRVR